MRLALVTESRYLLPRPGDPYVENIFLEDRLLGDALRARGIDTERVDWASDADWRRFDAAMFRTPWDWFDRFAAFSAWLRALPIRVINDADLVWWNLDKHYLLDLERRGVPIVPTRMVEPGTRSLREEWGATGWERGVAKPAVSGCARETWRIGPITDEDEARFGRLALDEAMLLQPFVDDVLVGGELSAVVIDGVLTHAVRKRAKEGDFRVQDDFGGTVERAEPTSDERVAAERAVAACHPAPLYARVDLVRGPQGEQWVSELELLEPELFLRFCPEAAERLGAALALRLG